MLSNLIQLRMENWTIDVEINCEQLISLIVFYNCPCQVSTVCFIGCIDYDI